MAKTKSDTPPLDDRTALIHELQAPLTVLRAQIESALRESWCGPECRAALEPCLEEVRNASQMVLDLLLLSRADAGKLDSERGPVDVQRLVSEVTRDYRIVAESKGIRFTLTNESTPSVIGDRRQLERILVNLLDNAIKYTTPGGSVRVELLYRKPSVEIQVLDTGCGISNEQLPRIFERFYQVNKAIAGVGLGLSIARTLAVQNGAELTVVSRPGEGSKFVLRLPAASDES